MTFEFFEFPTYPIKKRVLVTDLRLNDITIQGIGLDKVPTCQIVMPISVRNDLYSLVEDADKKRFEVIITDDFGLKDTGEKRGFQFHGLIIEENLAYNNCAWNFKLEHIIAEMRFDHLPANIPYKGELYVLFQGGRLEKEGWTYNFEDDDVKNHYLEYLYSKQDKLEALTDTVIKNTPYFHWQVDLGKRTIYIGRFGTNSDYNYHMENSSEYGIQMLKFPEKNIKYDEIANKLEVISSPTASGMANITVSELYRKPALQYSDFPITIAENANLDAESQVSDDVRSGQFNQVTFYIVDSASLASEGGLYYEAAKSDHDLFPIGYDNSPISDQDREDMAVNLYERGVRFLIAHRRQYQVSVDAKYHTPSQPYLGKKTTLRYHPPCVGYIQEDYYILGHNIVYPLNGEPYFSNVIFDTQLTEFRDMTDRQALVLKSLYQSNKRSFLIDWQRRASVQDTGQNDTAEGDKAEPAQVHVNLPKDYHYIMSWTMRFAFTPVRDSNGDVVNEKPSDIKMLIDDEDITEQLKAQSSTWLTSGFNWYEYFPTREDGVAFNIRKACKDKDPTDALWLKVTTAGNHVFTFQSTAQTGKGRFGVKITNNVKYSSSNKGF